MWPVATTAVLLFTGANAWAFWATTPAAVVAADTAPKPASNEVSSTANDHAHQLGRKLRCPVCQGMPISESPSTMAQDMMKRVTELVKEGKADDDVLQYFVARYGEWVLLEPPSRGFFVLVWIMPPIALVLLALWGIVHMRRLQSGAGHPPQVPAAVDVAGDDAFVQAIRNEVQR